MINTYKVGITGGIGSGKSTVCYIFEQLGIPVYYSDLRARQLINSCEEIKELYRRLFGNDIYTSGQLDRQRVGRVLFNNPGIKHEIEKVVHPVVRADFEQWIKLCNSDVVINEAAILFESGNYRSLDAVIMVTAPENLRLKRVMKRDGLTEMEIRDRIKHQWNDEKKILLSDFVIVCDDIQMVIPQVLNVYNTICKH